VFAVPFATTVNLFNGAVVPTPNVPLVVMFPVTCSLFAASSVALPTVTLPVPLKYLKRDVLVATPDDAPYKI
jgi:hypothetical protein